MSGSTGHPQVEDQEGAIRVRLVLVAGAFLTVIPFLIKRNHMTQENKIVVMVLSQFKLWPTE